jgi:hypothetical protein
MEPISTGTGNVGQKPFYSMTYLFVKQTTSRSGPNTAISSTKEKKRQQGACVIMDKPDVQ